jgi:hypothetical protein
MKKIIISLSFILLCFIAHSQNLIGLKGKEIREYMKANHNEMNYNKVVNNKFQYLKYSDNTENQTILFFLNRDSVCREVRFTYELGFKQAKIKEFGTKYKKSGENKWIEKRDGKNYTINMKEGKWSLVISIEPEK